MEPAMYMCVLSGAQRLPLPPPPPSLGPSATGTPKCIHEHFVLPSPPPPPDAPLFYHNRHMTMLVVVLLFILTLLWMLFWFGWRMVSHGESTTTTTTGIEAAPVRKEQKREEQEEKVTQSKLDEEALNQKLIPNGTCQEAPVDDSEDVKLNTHLLEYSGKPSEAESSNSLGTRLLNHSCEPVKSQELQKCYSKFVLTSFEPPEDRLEVSESTTPQGSPKSTSSCVSSEVLLTDPIPSASEDDFSESSGPSRPSSLPAFPSVPTTFNFTRKTPELIPRMMSEEFENLGRIGEAETSAIQ
ncbi:unnamed protein product [Caenorhabditis sp. 36 PRJEB53466]|nr:unnamed protein product [Caenorhabditis sp. 36 PRJEB53466]